MSSERHDANNPYIVPVREVETFEHKGKSLSVISVDRAQTPPDVRDVWSGKTMGRHHFQHGDIPGYGPSIILRVDYMLPRRVSTVVILPMAQNRDFVLGLIRHQAYVLTELPIADYKAGKVAWYMVQRFEIDPATIPPWFWDQTPQGV